MPSVTLRLLSCVFEDYHQVLRINLSDDVKMALLETLLKFVNSPYTANICGSLLQAKKVHPGEIKTFFVNVGDLLASMVQREVDIGHVESVLVCIQS